MDWCQPFPEFGYQTTWNYRQKMRRFLMPILNTLGRSPTKWNTNPYRISRRELHFFRCSPLLFIWLYGLCDYEGHGLKFHEKPSGLLSVQIVLTICTPFLCTEFSAVLLTLPSPCARCHRSSAGWPHRAACLPTCVRPGRSSRQWWE